MAGLPENVLSELRSPTRALTDLVDKFNKIARNHPDLPKLARMIGVLADEIVRRGAPPSLPIDRAEQPVAELGLC